MQRITVLLWLSLQLFLISACSTLPPRQSPAGWRQPTINSTARATTLATELADFRPLAEEALALRAETIKVGKRILSAQQQGGVLSGADLALLNEGVRLHLALRSRLLAVAEAHETWRDMSATELARAGLSEELRRQGVALSLASALVLYDNYLLAVSLFEGDAKLRRILNESDPAYAIRRAELDKVTLNYNSTSGRGRS